MNQLQKFSHNMFGNLEILIKDGKEYFPATDVARTLEYKEPHKAVTAHCDLDGDGGTTYPVIDGLGRMQEKKFITLGNVSRLIVAATKQSKNPRIRENAKQYERWIFDEVLPSIHKNGGYIQTKPEDTDEDILSRALLIAQKKISEKDELIQKQNKQLILQQPLVTFAEAVQVSKNTILVKDLATLLRQKGIDTGQNRLFEWLRSNGYLCSKKGMFNKPTQKSMDMQLFEVNTHVHTSSEGEFVTKYTPRVTGKGQLYFINKFLNKKAM